jgi:glutamate synthase domain-containing protein 3
MASTTLTVLTATLTGATITGVTAVASSETCTISPSTAQGALDFNSLKIRISAVGGSVTPTINAGTVFSAKGQGAKALSAIASSGTVIVGGQDFEGARFLITAGTIVFSFTGTGTASIEAYQYPRATE